MGGNDEGKDMNKVNKVPSGLLLASAALLGLSGTTLSAQPVYKSINAQGQTVYSSEPPARAVDVQEVELPQGPTQEQVKEARNAGERITQSANELQAERLTRERAADQKRQEAKVAAAEAKQEQAAAEQLQKNETLREYYGYRDYTFPTPAEQGGKGVTVKPQSK